jgi:hypothetical protein
LVALSSVHALWAACPLSTGAQVPLSLPVRTLEQALQPVQVVAQQKPSMQ